MGRTGWLGRFVVVLAVIFFFMSTAVLAAGWGRPRVASEACCQLIGRGAIGLKNLLLDGMHIGQRCLRRAGSPAAGVRQATRELHLVHYLTGIE